MSLRSAFTLLLLSFLNLTPAKLSSSELVFRILAPLVRYYRAYCVIIILMLDAGGKLCFLLLRQSTHSLQGIVEANEDPNILPREMVKFIAG
jgi:hypothetical protein